MRSRRNYLAAFVSGLAASAGCLTRNEAESGPNEPTERSELTDRSESPASPTEPAPDGVTVEDVVVREAITYESWMGAGGVLAGEGEQYVVAAVRTGTDPTDLEFSLETDVDTFEPGLPDTVGARNRTVAGHPGGPAWATSPPGDGSPYYLAFTVPSPLEATEPRIRVTGTETGDWPLSDEAREALAASGPRFELESLDAPEQLSQGEPLTVSLRVTNVADTDGRFLAAAYWPTATVEDDDESHLFERDVAAGETATATREIRTDYTAFEDGPVTLSVRGYVDAERDVRVQDTSTPS